MKIGKLLLISLFILCTLQNKVQAEIELPAEMQIEKYKIYKPNLKNEKNFFTLASGLSFYKANSYGKIRFYAVVDQFINLQKDEQAPPHVAIFKLGRKDFLIERYLPIVSNDSSINLNELDIEAVTTAPNEKLWLVDEIKNNLIEVDSNTGEVNQVLFAGKDFSNIFNQMQERRGLEGLCYLPQGALLATLQSPLKTGFDKLSDQAFIPFLYYDLKNKTSKIFVYEILEDVFDLPNEVKIGDVQAVNESSAIIIIRGIKAGKQIRRVELIEFSKATDISPKLKVESSAVELDSIKYEPVIVKKYLDLSATSYKHEKIEGLTIYENGQSLALVNDADGDLNNLELMTIQLSEPLITWGIFEWTIMIVLAVFFILSMYFMIIVLLKRGV
jgi:hypothetical protein